MILNIFTTYTIALVTKNHRCFLLHIVTGFQQRVVVSLLLKSYSERGENKWQRIERFHSDI